MNETKYYIQKAHKRTVFFHIDGRGERQFFLQLPNILFKIPYKIKSNNYLFNQESFCVYFIKKQYDPSESNVLLHENSCIPFEVTIPPFGNSTYFSVCLGEELEYYYQNAKFDSIEELTQNVIKNYWQSRFDDFSYNPIKKECFFYNWEKETKTNKPFDFNLIKEKVNFLPFEINKEKLMPTITRSIHSYCGH